MPTLTELYEMYQDVYEPLGAVIAALEALHLERQRAAGKDAADIAVIEGVLEALRPLEEIHPLPIRSICEKMAPLCESSCTQETRALACVLLKQIGAMAFNTRASVTITPSPEDVLLQPQLSTENGQEWAINLQKMFAKKSLKPFTPEQGLSLRSDIGEHVRWAQRHVYSVPYPGGHDRAVHGIGHVTRVASYIPVFANLYRKHGDKDAEQLTEMDMKLLQIAALFHDTAREDDGEDKWDHESALLLYQYLTTVLHVRHEKAKLIAEATANKDPHPEQGYFRIERGADDKLVWRFECIDPPPEKSIYQKLIHDADCLDIIRARPSFDANYLDFYKETASQPEHEEAFEDMAALIVEARGLISIQGSAYTDLKHQVMATYTADNADVYAMTRRDMQTHRLQLLATLSDKQLSRDDLAVTALRDLTPYDPTHGMSTQNLNAALREGRVFVRAVSEPTLRSKKHGEETQAGLELRKTMRTRGVGTRTRKSNRESKHGNPLRSVSMVGHGGGVLSKAGFMVLNPEVQAMAKVSQDDFDTGYDKKIESEATMLSAVASEQALATGDLVSLHHKMKMGGHARHLDYAPGRFSTHNEIIYHLSRYDAIYFTPDATCRDQEKRFKNSRAAGLLEALFLQEEYRRAYIATKTAYIAQFGEAEGLKHLHARFGEREVLPIVAYSIAQSRLEPIPETALTDEKIVQLWVESARPAMKKLISFDRLRCTSMDEIKRLALGADADEEKQARKLPADCYYSDALKAKVNAALEKERQAVLQVNRGQLSQCLQADPTFLFVDQACFKTILLEMPEMLDDKALRQALSDETVLGSEVVNLNIAGEFRGISRFSLMTSQMTQALLQGTYAPEELLRHAETFRRLSSFLSVRLYVVSQRLGCEAVTREIQERVAAHVEGILSSDQAFSQLTRLVFLCITFGLLPQYQEKIHEIIQGRLADHRLPLECVAEIMAVLHETDLHETKEEHRLLVDCYDYHRQRLLNNSFLSSWDTAISDLVEFSHQLGVSRQAVQTWLLPIIRRTGLHGVQAHNPPSAAYAALSRYYPLTAETDEFFQRALASISSGSPYRRPDPLYWWGGVVALEQSTATKHFSHDQQLWVEQFWIFSLQQYCDANQPFTIEKTIGLIDRILKNLPSSCPPVPDFLQQQFTNGLAAPRAWIAAITGFEIEALIQKLMVIHRQLPDRAPREADFTACIAALRAHGNILKQKEEAEKEETEKAAKAAESRPLASESDDASGGIAKEDEKDSVSHYKKSLSHLSRQAGQEGPLEESGERSKGPD